MLAREKKEDSASERGEVAMDETPGVSGSEDMLVKDVQVVDKDILLLS